MSLICTYHRRYVYRYAPNCAHHVRTSFGYLEMMWTAFTHPHTLYTNYKVLSTAHQQAVRRSGWECTKDVEKLNLSDMLYTDNKVLLAAHPQHVHR